MDGAASLLAESLKFNSSLDVLDLSENAISNFGARSLADALEINYSLKDLDLSSNRIKMVGFCKDVCKEPVYSASESLFKHV
jgi:Ran GTPase-activating protein (RanGAP) involved in mRNA processing and transport